MKISFDANSNIILLDGAMVYLHCHHYNCGLIKVLEDIEGIRARDIIVQSAAEEFYTNFSEYIKKYLMEKTDFEKLNAAEDLYRFMGFGRIDLSGVNDKGGMVYANSSYYVIGWLAKYGRRDKPLCYLTCGFLSGVLSAVYLKPLDYYKVIEKHCMITGHSHCEFIVSVNY